MREPTKFTWLEALTIALCGMAVVAVLYEIVWRGTPWVAP